MVLARRRNPLLSRHGLTLVELILAITLCGVAMTAVIAAYNFLFVQLRHNIEYGNVNLQVANALESIRLHCLNAVSIDNASIFEAEVDSSKAVFCFNADKDVYNITPDDPDDNLDYCYYKDPGTNALMLNSTSASSATPTDEILVDGKYNPSVSFEYTAASTPDIFTVIINATALTATKPQESRVTRKKSVRFWYTPITK